MINFVDILNEAKRKAQLTGQPITPQEMKGITTGWFDTAAAMANKTRAEQIREKQAADALAQQKWETQEQMDAARKSNITGTISNIGQNAVSTLGVDYLKADPGESMISKGYQGIKGIAGRLVGPGDGAAAPTFNTALNAPQGIDLTGIGGLAPVETAAPEMSGLGWAAEPAAAEAGAEGVGTTLGTIGSGVSTAISTAAPYYALAKGGGMLVNSITANNPELKETPFGRLGRSLENPVTGVERAWGEMAAEKGIGDVKTNKIVAGVFNPVGGIIEELGGGCIIVTACTDRNSPEVEICRQYRDKFLDKDQLRGYYVLAEKIVPILERSNKAKQFCKKWVVDRLIDYGEKRLGKRQRPYKLISFIVSKLFLALIKITGVVVPHYTRQNGEVY